MYRLSLKATELEGMVLSKSVDLPQTLKFRSSAMLLVARLVGVRVINRFKLELKY